MSPESKSAEQGILTEITRIRRKVGPAVDEVVLDIFRLTLDTGIQISLPPEAQGATIQHLKVGDSFTIAPWERVIEGSSKVDENALEIKVTREGQWHLQFVVNKDWITKKWSLGEAAQEVASNLAAAILKKRLAKGGSIEIQSLGISIKPDGT